MAFINTATIGEGYEGLANAVIIRALVDYYDAQRTIKGYRSRLHILEETHAKSEFMNILQMERKCASTEINNWIREYIRKNRGIRSSECNFSLLRYRRIGQRIYQCRV